jgi:uncharacterized protein YbbC (DUF1343 family)
VRKARPAVRPGLEALLARSGELRGRRIGLLANQASVDSDLRHAADLLRACDGVKLAALFAPEHGLRGEAQDMEAVESGIDPATGLPVHSLYGSAATTLAPTDEMLAGLDLVICDLPDIGSRYYTFAATLFQLMEKAAESGLPVLVTDRPNPLGGEVLEGPGLEPAFTSFVGRVSAPVRHGLTMGELARLYNEDHAAGSDLTVVPMQGWRRRQLGPETGLPWVPPSPNMPTFATALVYPGGCLLEGTNLSEGRGTTRPFEFAGGPWIDAVALAGGMNDIGRPGVRFRPHWFRPVAQKWKGETCGGVQVHVTDPETLRSFGVYVELVAAMRRQDPDRFQWRTEAYEFESQRPAIDLLAGSDRLRKDLERGRAVAEMEVEWHAEAERFRVRRRDVLLYPEED